MPKHKIPWHSSVTGAPIFFETAPTTRLPNGTVPYIAIIKMLITLPLMRGVDSDCTIILPTVNCATAPKPINTAKNMAIGKFRICEKQIIAIPNTALNRNNIFRSEALFFSEAKITVPTIEPAPIKLVI